MNCTLVELACAMLTAAHLPEFLWEPAIKHAAYIQNRSYTKVIPEKTPYQGWYLEKLNVSHLQEFGSPVWILNQGQYAKQKILPKSHQYYYMGNKDGSDSIIYYNKQMKKLHISRNFHFIQNIPHMPLDTYNPVHKGEQAGRAIENARKIESLDNKQPCTRPQNSKNQEYTDKRDTNETLGENNNKDKGSDNGTLVPQKRKATEPLNIDTP